jgi:N-acetylmuramoyl-L-alanine amidase
MITISAGHWAVGTGASGIIDEVTEARKVAKRVVEILKLSNVTVNHVEDNVSKNKSDNLKYLINQHNKTKRKLDVSVHFNASLGGTVGKGIGTEVLYYNEVDLATKLSKAISSVSGLIDRGAKQRKDLAFLSGSNVPAVLLEICFVNSSVDVALYRRDFEKICQTIASTIQNHLGISELETDTKKDVNSVKLLSATGRHEIRQLLKSARDLTIIESVHTDEKINNYSDIELLSYQAAVINRTFNK